MVIYTEFSLLIHPQMTTANCTNLVMLYTTHNGFHKTQQKWDDEYIRLIHPSIPTLASLEYLIDEDIDNDDKWKIMSLLYSQNGGNWEWRNGNYDVGCY